MLTMHADAGDAQDRRILNPNRVPQSRRVVETTRWNSTKSAFADCGRCITAVPHVAGGCGRRGNPAEARRW